MQVFEFETIHEVESGCYNVPLKHNFPTIDSLCPSRGEIYQVTKGERDVIKGNHLESLKPLFSKQISRNKPVKFIFIVPPDRYRNFTIQRIVDSSKKQGGKKSPPLMQVPWIKQYVMEVDATPLVTSFDNQMGRLIRKRADPTPQTGKSNF